ncbi:unnamed protein product [Mytilus coruscus]|uniref:Ig-like domain-containing protein n=1 Tax=Mytilus coruscus TaxID=42192 RepID=A0A6J8ASX3_MYTCO|nr:unnamed protein product [Mytilus coruscus]
MIGNVHRSFNLLCIFLVLQRPVPVRTQVPPGSPVITGPEIIMMGETVTLTCTVNGGSPPPTVKWFVNDVVIDDTATTVGSTTLNSFTFTAVAKDHLKVFECQTENGVLQNPLSRTQFIRVHRTPNPPILTGPTTIVAGVLTKWTCRSEEGYPMQSMSMRLGNASFGRGFTSNSRLIGLKSYTVIGTLYWAPSTLNDKHMLYCDVYHKETLGANTPQTVGLLLSVKSNFTIKTPKDFYDPITGQSATLIVDVMSGKATKVSWYKNNYLIDASSNSRYSGGNYQTPSLTINRVELDDAGSYRASVTDGSDTKNTTITVSPKATPRQPTLTGPTSLTAGTTGSWTCISHGGFPLQTMSMRIGNKIFDSNDMSIYSQYEPAVMSFRIVSLQLTVKTPLSVRAPTTTYHPEVTKEVTLTVDIKGNPTEIRWIYQIFSLDESTVSPTTTDENPMMTNDSSSSTESNGTKDIIGEPTVGKSITLYIDVTSSNIKEVKWYKNNKEIHINSDPRLSGGNLQTNSLTIKNVQLLMQGIAAVQ